MHKRNIQIKLTYTDKTKQRADASQSVSLEQHMPPLLFKLRYLIPVKLTLPVRAHLACNEKKTFLIFWKTEKYDVWSYDNSKS